MPELPIRVMRIIARLNVGGPALHVSLLTAGLNDDTFQSSLLVGKVSSNEGDMTYYARSKGIQPQTVPRLGKSISLLSDVSSLWTLYRLMRKQRPHVVHTHTSKAGFVGRLAAWLAGVPVIVHTHHGHFYYGGYFGAVSLRLFKIVEKFTARISSCIITLSPSLKSELVAYGIAPASKMHVVPLGLELEPFVSAAAQRGQFRTELGLRPDTPLVGIVGRLVPVKNHVLFIEAAARLKQSKPETHFVIVGDGELRGELEVLVEELDLSDNITFVGWRQDLPAIFADLSTTVIASHNEGTPVSAIESMAAGVPVIATAVGGIPELLGEGRYGTLILPGDADALASAMLGVLQQANVRRVESARVYALSEFGSGRLIQDMRSLYAQLLEEKGMQFEVQTNTMRVSSSQDRMLS